MQYIANLTRAYMAIGRWGRGLVKAGKNSIVICFREPIYLTRSSVVGKKSKTDCFKQLGNIPIRFRDLEIV